MPTINTKKICKIHGIYKDKSCPKCDKHRTKVYDKNYRAKDRKKVYNSKKWKLAREKALLRDSMLCVICKAEGKETLAKEVDHIEELRDDMTKAYDLDNLQSLCIPCHRKKTQREKEKRW